eukprot:15322528-Ditylum_brightwellii.AAC.1
MHRNNSTKPAEEWRGVRLHGIVPTLSHANVEAFTKNDLVEICQYIPSYRHHTSTLTIYSMDFFTTYLEIAAVVPPSLRLPSFTIGEIEDTRKHNTKKKPAHMLPTPNITPEEASMAFDPVNSEKGDSPKSLLGHRGKVYMAWVMGQNREADTFLGLFRKWKQCKRAVHCVSNAGFKKVRNLSRAFKEYPDLLQPFITEY